MAASLTETLRSPIQPEMGIVPFIPQRENVGEERVAPASALPTEGTICVFPSASPASSSHHGTHNGVHEFSPEAQSGAIPTFSAENWFAKNWNVLRAAVRRTYKGNAQEDAEQEAALSMWIHWDSGYDPQRGSREAWGAAIAARKGIDYSRSDAARSRTAEKCTQEAKRSLHQSSPVNPETIAVQRDEIRRLWKDLSPAEREMVRLRALGLSDLQIAERLKIPLGTFKSRYRRMRLKVLSERNKA